MYAKFYVCLFVIFVLFNLLGAWGSPPTLKKELYFSKKNLYGLLIFTLIFLMLISPPILSIIFISLIAMGGAKEIFNAVHQKYTINDVKILKIFSFIIAGFFPFLFYYLDHYYLSYILFSTIVLIMLIPVVMQDIVSTFVKIATSIFSLLWVMSICTFMLIRKLPEGSAFCLFIYFTIYSTDGFALLFGKRFKGATLAPKLSPHKTWIGATGAGLVSMCVAPIFCGILQLPFSLPFSCFVGLIISISGQLGDLLGSLFKREAGIKDYGTILPAHGGILDRFDSCIIALPIFYMVLMM